MTRGCASVAATGSTRSSKYFSASAVAPALAAAKALAAGAAAPAAARAVAAAEPVTAAPAHRTSKAHPRAAPTSFQLSVYELIKTIPRGKVASYAQVARELGKDNGARAVGNALRNNPFAPAVPCHRVVATSRELGGFAGQVGSAAPNLAKKKELLRAEGVLFEPSGDKVARASMFVWCSRKAS